MGYHFWDSKSHKVVQNKDATFNEDPLYEAKAAIDYSNLTKPNQKDQMVLEDSPKNHANKTLVAEHGVSSEITQSLGGSLDTSEGSENSRRFEDSGRSDEEDSKDKASSEEEGSETPHVRRSTKESKAPVRYSPSVNYLLLTKNGELESYSEALSSKESVQWVKEEQDGSKRGFSVSWERRKPHVQVEEKSVQIKASTETMIKDLGSTKKILGMCIIRDITKGTLRLSQEKYIGKVSEKFNMKDAKARCQPLGDHFKLSKKLAPKTEASRRRMGKVPYASEVGSVMYAMVCTRPDIDHVVGVVSIFMSNPGREHWEAVKWLLRYLKGTLKATLCFSRKEVVLEGLSDSDYECYLDSGRSTTGYIFTVGGTTVSWMSRIQKCVTMSTIEAEYMAIAEVGKELVSLKNFLEELNRAQTERCGSLTAEQHMN
ncbi:hypothetical protein Tco_1173814 [Tanacetum coccineum]